MSIPLTTLLDRVPENVAGQVKAARDSVRLALQEGLRAECRLVMRTAEETELNRKGGQVPIKIDEAYPEFMKDVAVPDEAAIAMALGPYRTDLENTRNGVSRLLELRQDLSENSDIKLDLIEPDHLQKTHDWAAGLLQQLEDSNVVDKILHVNQDCLGVYEYDFNTLLSDDRDANPARIRLYYCVISVVSNMLGCTIEDLTIVVLAHEMSHAYTQLGADIEGRRWAVEKFSTASVELKEGLAQYYTDRVLRRLDRRYPGALLTYKRLLKCQSKVYNAHKKWIMKYNPESVRRAMLEVRRLGEFSVQDFERRLDDAFHQLGGGAPTVDPKELWN